MGDRLLCLLLLSTVLLAMLECLKSPKSVISASCHLLQLGQKKPISGAMELFFMPSPTVYRPFSNAGVPKVSQKCYFGKLSSFATRPKKLHFGCHRAFLMPSLPHLLHELGPVSGSGAWQQLSSKVGSYTTWYQTSYLFVPGVPSR